MEGTQVQLDPVSALIQFHHTAASNNNEPSWYGYLQIRSETDIALGNSYTLHLEDGRSGTLRIDEICADSPGKLRAIFVGNGPLH